MFSIRYNVGNDCYDGYENGTLIVSKPSVDALKTAIVRKRKLTGVDVTLLQGLYVLNKQDIKTYTPLQLALIRQTQLAAKRCLKLFNVRLGEVKVDFFSKGTSAGKAWQAYNKVTYNIVLAEENPELFHLIVLHEVAHLVVYKKFPGARHHGKEFKSVLLTLGGDGKRCHTLDTTSLERKV